MTSKKVYCICEGPSTVGMVGCDGKGMCPYRGWFHITCVERQGDRVVCLVSTIRLSVREKGKRKGGGEGGGEGRTILNSFKQSFKYQYYYYFITIQYNVMINKLFIVTRL